MKHHFFPPVAHIFDRLIFPLSLLLIAAAATVVRIFSLLPFPTALTHICREGEREKGGASKGTTPSPSVRSCPSCPNKLWHVTHIRPQPFPMQCMCVFERHLRRSDPTRGAAKEGRKIASDLTFTPFVEIEWGDWISRQMFKDIWALGVGTKHTGETEKKSSYPSLSTPPSSSPRSEFDSPGLAVDEWGGTE